MSASPRCSSTSAERGFSFRLDGPLDMRMGGDGPSAADVVNRFEPRDLARVIAVLGEEKRARAVAAAIARARAREADRPAPRELAEIVARAVGHRATDTIHPATRTFQALRIFVNRELDELAEALAASERVLAEGGRLVVVAFHSLEDRIVKRFLAERSATRAARLAPPAGGGDAATRPSNCSPAARRARRGGDRAQSAGPLGAAARRAAHRRAAASRSTGRDRRSRVARVRDGEG